MAKIQSENNRLTLRIENHIGILTLNRADKLNAFDMPMFYQIDNTLKQLRRNKTLRALIVNAKGDDFSSGLDVKSVMQNRSNIIRLLWKWLPGQANLAQRMSYAFRTLPVPVIVAIKGRCWGAGLQLALGGDIRIADKNCSLSIMEGRWGLIPDMGGTLALRELMPVDKALELAINAEEINAERALAFGLIRQIDDKPMDVALTLAQQFSERSPDTIGALKKLYHYAWAHNTRKVLAKETFYQWRIIFGKNRLKAIKQHKNGIKAEFAKRQNW